MTREEAINLIKQVLPCLNIDEKIREGFETLIPELKESEDEKIRKELLEEIEFIIPHDDETDSEGLILPSYHARIDRYKSYLEKQKEQPITANDLDEEIHRFFDDCIDVHEVKLYGNISERVIPVDCYEITARHFAKWGEKQKDASKAIEAVERIDKYIDEHFVNAHDMKDSNPDKKYYRGWDDALGKMAGILQDVYSGEKQKESLRDFIDNFPYSAEQEEQDWNKKPCLTCQEYEKGHKQGYTEGCTAGYNKAMKEMEQKEQKPSINIDQLKSLMLQYLQEAANEKDDSDIEADTDKWARKILGYDFEQKPAVEQLDGTFNSYDMAKTFVEGQYYVMEHPERFGLCKPAEWSENESNLLDSIIEDYEKANRSFCGYDGKIGLLKAIRSGEYNLPKQEWSEEDMNAINAAATIVEGKGLKDIANRLKFLRNRPKQSDIWKPSEEQMKALKNVAYGKYQNGDGPVLRVLCEQLGKL